MKRAVLLLALAAACATTTATPPPPPPPAPPAVAEAPKPALPPAPVARKVPLSSTLHGETRVDEYAWLRQKDDAAVLAHLEAENAYADALLAPTQALQEQLYQEMLGRIQQADLGVPAREGGYFYYTRTEEGKQYSLYCRKQGHLAAPEQVLLDLNALAAGKPFIALRGYKVSDDGSLLAYALDYDGSRLSTVYFKDLRTGQLLPERLERVSNMVWAADGRTLFYVTFDSAVRPYRLYRHTLGTDPAKDTLLYEEKDERFRTVVSRSRNKEWLFFTSGSSTTSEVRILPARTPVASWRLVAERQQGHEYYLEHRGDTFYIQSNRTGPNFALYTAPVRSPEPAQWKELVPHRPQVMLEEFDLFEGHLVLSEREGGLQQVAITDLQSNQTHRLGFPESVYTVFLAANPEFKTRKLRFNYQSPITPPSVLEYDMDTREQALLKEEPVLGGYDRSRYQTERLYATAADGTQVPISLVYRKGLERNGRAPLLLEGYGSYGFPNFMGFSSTELSLLDRGMVLATAHIRGGGDMGKAWHEAGRMLTKKNTFTDFIAVAEHLIAQRYTSPERLAITGASAGGLLMGAVVNMRPELFHAVVARVPFVDVINTMLDTSLPLTVGEFEEWGNPQEKTYYEYMRSYCPYTNLAAKAYPAMLVRTGLNDTQVGYWEPAKYVAKMRTLKTNDTPLLLKVHLGAGHGGSSGRYDRLRELALDYAFILTQLGVEQGGPAQGSAQDEALLRQLVADQAEAWNRGDAKAWSKDFAPEADFVNIYGGVFQGQQEIEERHAFVFKTFFKGSQARVSVRRLAFLAPDLALVDTDHEVSGFPRLPPGVQPLESGRMLTHMKYVLRKGTGGWRIIAGQNTNAAPPPPRQAAATQQ
jgi:oligopeptidase B